MKHPRLERHRQRIARVDEELVRLLALRLELVESAWATKEFHGIPLIDPSQERKVLRRARAWGREHGVPRKLVDELFTLVLNEGQRSARRKGPGRAQVRKRRSQRPAK